MDSVKGAKQKRQALTVIVPYVDNLTPPLIKT